jgi:anti-sigma regulatory factor (Ser/Thr protein kinase)
MVTSAMHAHSQCHIASSWDGVSADTLRLAMSMRTACVESVLADLPVKRAVEGGDDARLCLVVSTRAAYHTPVARVFADILANRASLSFDLQERVSTAIQEAMMNAVIHGNLRIEASLRNDIDGLTDLHKRIEQQLLDAKVAQQPITIKARWDEDEVIATIRDSGPGFAADRKARSVDGNVSASGRGLAIMQAFCDRIAIEDGGRTTKLSFDR